MEDYWKAVGEAVDRRKRVHQYLSLKRDREKHPNVEKNRKRWPKGAWQVRQALRYLGIYHKREYLIPLPGSTFFLADFALLNDRVFVEIDGAGHVPARDRWREDRIRKIPDYADWSFVRLKTEECFDKAHLYVVFGRYATKLRFLGE